jgi:hypothetical protein
MIMHRTIFFLALFGILLIPLLAPRMLWLLRAEKAMGLMAFETRGTAGDQLPLTYSLIYFSHGKDIIWFNGVPGLRLKTGQLVPVRYQTRDPADAKIDLFIALWGDILVYGGVPFLILLVAFLHPDVIPYRSRVRLTRKRPFIFILAQ